MYLKNYEIPLASIQKGMAGFTPQAESGFISFKAMLAKRHMLST